LDLSPYNTIPDLVSAPLDQSYEVSSGLLSFTMPAFDDLDVDDTFTTYFTV